MAIDFDAMLDRALGVLGTAATYTPAVGDPVSVTIMPAQQDEIVGFGETKILGNNRLLCELLVSAVANPAEDETITISSVVYVIKSVRYLDEERLIWLVDCYKQ